MTTMYSEAATQFATRDPRPAADHILNTACQRAIDAFLDGDPDYARQELDHAAARAERLLRLVELNAAEGQR